MRWFVIVVIWLEVMFILFVICEVICGLFKNNVCNIENLLYGICFVKCVLILFCNKCIIFWNDVDKFKISVFFFLFNSFVFFLLYLYIL